MAVKGGAEVGIGGRVAAEVAAFTKIGEEAGETQNLFLGTSLNSGFLVESVAHIQCGSSRFNETNQDNPLQMFPEACLTDDARSGFRFHQGEST